MSPLDSNDDDNVLVYLVDETEIDNDFLDHTLAFCSDGNDLCLAINVSFDPDHEFHVVVVLLEHNSNCFPPFISTLVNL